MHRCIGWVEKSTGFQCMDCGEPMPLPKPKPSMDEAFTDWWNDVWVGSGGDWDAEAAKVAAYAAWKACERRILV